MFVVMGYYNSVQQPPGTILLFQGCVSITYGVNNKIVKYHRYFKNVVTRPEIATAPPTTLAQPTTPPPTNDESMPPSPVRRRSARKSTQPKKRVCCSPFLNTDSVWANPL